MKGLYLYLMLFTVSFPLARSFEPKVKYSSRWKSLFPAIMITAAFFIVWDVRFTKLGVWGFSNNYTANFRVLGLPLEEWSFFFVAPFASVFIYEVVVFFFPHVQSSKASALATASLGFMLVCISILNVDKAYTFWNLLFAGFLLIYIALDNPQWLGKFWIAYILHLIPFFMVNGILTGSLLEEPIVWYGQGHILGIRLGTVPVEDTIYSLLLLLLNVKLYEKLNDKWGLR